ncbi:undecaprenyl/decaprenyl-phosphate alpha-N-acetylglucosaminyl 1-phosphate transferase [Candidatus Kuenenbacteria bacterium]|nr:undecaprenyl/decaprenyl-phosphate alpha-N-acetylglucosaminyl 1-phosphate transferase [Candidatus Kuenenbacteria bacterium]
MLRYFLPPILAFIASLLLTRKVRQLALRYNIVDAPTEERKIQKGHVPLLGGLAVYFSFLITLLICWGGGLLSDGKISISKILGIILGGLIICIVGFLDDRYNLKTKSFFGPLLAALVAVGLGITIGYITNPFLAGTGPYGRALFYFGGIIGPLASFFWLLGMMYTTKFLDGLDGLVSGIGAIGSIILFIVSLFWDVPQSSTSILCLALAGSCLGFLVYNWHPASIFLGESGSVFIGFMLGILSIISGGKIATALLIMGIPILDVIWVIFRRIFKERKSPFSGDRKHLHFRLLDAGFSHRKVVLFLYLITLIFGTSSLFLQSQNKVTALGILIIFMLILAITLIRFNKTKIKS